MLKVCSTIKVPIPEAIQVIRNRLVKDDTLEERTRMTPQTICHLVQLCMKYTYFEFDNNLYVTCYAKRDQMTIIVF